MLSVMKVGTISVLAAAALMPVRNGFSWDAEAKEFKIDPALRQVTIGAKRQPHSNAMMGISPSAVCAVMAGCLCWNRLLLKAVGDSAHYDDVLCVACAG